MKFNTKLYIHTVFVWTYLMKRLITILLLVVFICGCNNNDDVVDRYSERESVEATLNYFKGNIDSIIILANTYYSRNDLIGMMLAYNALGKAYRERAEFSDAIQYHKMSLLVAETLVDTLEIIQCYNEIATNYRRLGILDEASAYHFEALSICDKYSEKETYSTIKSRVKTLNGIGNIYLSIGNWQAADSIFRLALVGEHKLGSALGQAINYANIGSIFEKNNQLDSARYYYETSLILNDAAKSDLGQALCFIHLGNIFEKENKLDNAADNYKNALLIMDNSTDKWHWLEACISLANVNFLKGDIKTTNSLLQRALDIAQQVKSWEHLETIHKLYYRIYERQHNYQKALNEFILSSAFSDSVEANANVYNLINTRVKYEQEKSSQQILAISESLSEETQSKTNILWISAIIALILAIGIYFLLFILKIRKRSVQAMKKMEQVRNNFFTNITHEFRTPLTIILGLTNQLQQQDSNNNEKQTAESLNTISKQGQNLLNLVNQLLDISKVSSDIEEPDWRVGNIVAQVRMIVDSYKIYARQKVINLCFETEQLNIDCDFVPSYITKIVSNLLSNSLKYTPKNGTITVSISTNDDNIILKISDTGIGINDNDQKHIFELFYQVDNKYSKQGSGIGLPLVKQLVDKMDGKITVSGKENEGTSFEIELKRKQKRTGLKRWIPDIDNDIAEPSINHNKLNDTNLPLAAPNVNCEKTQPLIMIVDDNIEIAHYIGNILKNDNSIVFAENGAEGFEKAQELVPDLIITDIMMPEIDGYELCHLLRTSNILNHIPIIVVTAKCTEADRIKSYEVGADAFIVKPFNPEELKVRVNSLLELRQKLRNKYSHIFYDNNNTDYSASSSDNEFINKITDIIYAQLPNHDFNTDQLAQRMCMSVSQLNRRIKSLTGYSTANFAMQIRIEKVKRELGFTDKPIADIADICGFADSSHLTRVFKQYTNMTPSQFRKSPKE